MKMFIRFSYHFFSIVGYLKSVFLSLIALIVISAAVIAQFESLPFGEAPYLFLSRVLPSDTAILSLRRLSQG